MKRYEVLELGKSYIGTTESPKNSNNVIFNTDYYGHPVSGSRYPWCCAYVWDIFRMANAKKYFYGGKKTASCTTLMNYYKKNNPDWVLKDPMQAQPGDIVFFQFDADSNADHVGIVDHVIDSKYMQTVEGNTSYDEKGSQSNGGCVASKKRSKSVIMCVVHIHYDDDAKISNPYPVPTRTLKYSVVKMKGDDVKWLQHQLNCKINAGLKVDGIFGKATRGAVKDYQRAFNLKVDGYAGPATRASLLS